MMLKDKVIVLTGASSGIGRATALALAREQATLHLIARREQRLAEVCAEVRELGATVTAHPLDVRDGPGITRTAAKIQAECGAIDVLINNAGVGPVRSFLDTSEDDWDWTLDTNLRAVIRGVRAFLPAMLERGTGTIVNVASLAGLMANPLAAYTASKFAVVGLSESLLIEYGPKGIEVVVVCPGVIDTEIAGAANLAGRSDPELDARMQRFMSKYGVAPDTVANAIVRAIHRPRFLVLSPRHATVLRTLHRVAPGPMRRALSRYG